MTTEELAKLAQSKIAHKTGPLGDFSSTMLSLFKQNGLKTLDHEQYRFTALNSFVETLNLAASSSKAIHLETFETNAFINLIFVDGQIKTPIPSVAGIKFSTIESAFSDIVSLFKNENPCSELHHSMISQGMVIEIAAQTKIEKPIRIINLISDTALCAFTTVIKVGNFAEVCLIEENTTQQIPQFTLGETYLTVGTGAQVEHVQVSTSGTQALTHTSTKAVLAKDSNYRNVLFNLAGKLNRRNLAIDLVDSGANGESYALYLTDESEHSDINTAINHKAADTTSNQVAKGILDGDSKGIFTGKIHIFPHAQRVASGQLNKNLLLSKKAHAHSQPQLEIFADDVKCSHGSTTGQLSDDEVFYFEARGIPQERAKTLLALGFGLEIVQKIKNKTLRQHLEAQVRDSLKAKFKLGGSL